ncbi:MAG: preprotein translocase subunit SecA, partial [Candidatus Saccharibacteria bacterium]|nr:preprotein translocase subunit SecA [Candidatus Saccharibacteria bacterium]
ALMERLGVPDDQAISAKPVSKTLEAAQKRVEGYNFDTRKNVVQYDNVINRHRKVVYSIRRKILQGDDISPEVLRLADERLADLLRVRIKKDDTEKLEKIQEIFPVVLDELGDIANIKNDKKRMVAARKLVLNLYDTKESELGGDLLRGAEREIYMQVLDVLWMQHLENMQHLREGIHWRSIGQRDPLVEYRVESQKLFDSLQRTLQEEVLKIVFRLQKNQINTDQVEDDKYDSDLTKAAASAVEKGVNEAGLPKPDDTDESDFRSGSPEKSQSDKNRAKRQAQKKKKQQRQNRKNGRK